MTDRLLGQIQQIDRQDLIIAIIAGESSGDQLGSRLMASIKSQSQLGVRFVGVGGPLMEAEGLSSIFPMSDIAVNGIFPVIARLPLLLNRIKATAFGIAREKPDIVVHIDAQDFNQRVARKLRRLIPETPLVGYVSPTVWAWRPGRAKKIKNLYAKLLAVLPFEPEVHRKLGGPETFYVGHPLLERKQDWTRTAEEDAALLQTPGKLLILPGSRESEVRKLLPLFRAAVQELTAVRPTIEILMPVVEHLAPLIHNLVADWPMKPQLIRGESGKWAAFRASSAALAASGTVTLELALAQVPTVVVYRVSFIEEMIGRLLITSKYASLPNIILDRALLPEFLSKNWKSKDLVPLLLPLMQTGKERDQQLAGFVELKNQMMLDKNNSAAGVAARHILTALKN